MMFFQGITEVVAERALNSIPAGLMIATLAWVGLRAFKKHDSEIRFAVWFLALVGIAAVPFAPSFGGSAGVSGALHARITLPAAWADAIFGLWIAVVALVTLRLFVGICKLWDLQRESAPVALSDLSVEAQQAIVDFRHSRAVEICSSSRVRVPTALGLFRPTVLLPDEGPDVPASRFLVPDVALALEHPQLRADGGVVRIAGEIGHHLELSAGARGRLSPQPRTYDGLVEADAASAGSGSAAPYSPLASAPAL